MSKHGALWDYHEKVEADEPERYAQWLMAGDAYLQFRQVAEKECEHLRGVEVAVMHTPSDAKRRSTVVCKSCGKIYTTSSFRNA